MDGSATYALLLRCGTVDPDRARERCNKMLKDHLPHANRHAYREEFAGQRRAVEGKYFRRRVLVEMLGAGNFVSILDYSKAWR